MYIEFSLPQGAGGLAAAHTYHALKGELRKWSQKHNIDYREKVIKYKVKVTFVNSDHYTFFSLTWEPKSSNSYINRFELIEPMK